jgi:hypothetical protein
VFLPAVWGAPVDLRSLLPLWQIAANLAPLMRGKSRVIHFNPPPSWPPVPEDWTPPEGWQPGPAWGPVPKGWDLWIGDDGKPARRRLAVRWIVGRWLLFLVVVLVIGAAANAGHPAGDIVTLASLGLLGWAIAGLFPRKVTGPTGAAPRFASPLAVLPTAARHASATSVPPPPSRLPPTEHERRLRDDKRRHDATVTKGLIAGIVAVILVVVVVAVSSYRNGARCRDAHRELHTAWAAAVANGIPTPQETSFLDAVIEDDPSCFDASTRAFAKVGGSTCHLNGNSITCASG